MKQDRVSAKGKTGFIIDGGKIFRIYHSNGMFTDYSILADDFEVRITDSFVDLVEESPGEGFLDYNEDVLGTSGGSPEELDFDND